MKTRTFTALIPGYGVPKNILTDRNYGAYLSVCFNTLFDKYRDAAGTVFVSGGHTDCFPPYKRTEAREMRRWFLRQKSTAERAYGRPLRWRIVMDYHALTTIENMLNFSKIVRPHTDIVVFIDKTRAARMRRFAKAALKRQARIVPVDFDTSLNRYQIEAIADRERVDLKFSLMALKDPKVMKLRRDFAKEKLKIMRKLGPKKGHEQLARILTELKKKYMKKM